MLDRGRLTMDPARHRVTWGGDNVTLTVTEFLILEALAQRPGVVKTRNQLMDAAYQDDIYVDDRTIDSHIKRVRRKFRAGRSASSMRSKRCMAPATVSRRNERRRDAASARHGRAASSLTPRILAVNIFALALLGGRILLSRFVSQPDRRQPRWRRRAARRG